MACTDLREAAAAETLALIEAAGGQGLAAALDVRAEDGFAAAVEQLRSAWGGVDLLA